MVIQTGAYDNMIPGINRLRTASQLLRRAGDGSTMPLLGSASEIWSAMFELPSWPTELREKAVELQSTLFRYGTIQMTIDQMVEPERMQLRRELLEFIEFAERLNHDGTVTADRDGAADGDGSDGRLSDGRTSEHPR